VERHDVCDVTRREAELCERYVEDCPPPVDKEEDEGELDHDTDNDVLLRLVQTEDTHQQHRDHGDHSADGQPEKRVALRHEHHALQ
jgi:hypothetical protein